MFVAPGEVLPRDPMPEPVYPAEGHREVGFLCTCTSEVPKQQVPLRGIVNRIDVFTRFKCNDQNGVTDLNQMYPLNVSICYLTVSGRISR